MKENFTDEIKLWRTTKYCALQGILAIVFCGVSIAHTNYDQLLDTKIRLTLLEVPLADALSKIEELTQVKFFYSIDQVDMTRQVSIKAPESTLRTVLDELLTPLGINYKVHEKEWTITLNRNGTKNKGLGIREKNGLKIDLSDVIRGKVTDAATQFPLAGVNVVIKGTTIGTTTGAEGTFGITAGNKDILVFSFIGYATAEIQVNDLSFIDVAMVEDIKSLNEVVINVGYWEVKEKEQTGNISRITSREIQKQPVANPLSALQGRMTGVYVQESSGIPGSGIKIQIRGQNSLRNSINDNGNLPLYIVDGVPFTSTSLSSGFLNLSNGSPLIAINPNDIESIEVLKDADATAIYGSRGANGVVLIKTKSGYSGKTKFDVSLSRGVGEVGHKMDLLNTSQYLQMRREGYTNDGVTTIPDDFETYDIHRWDSTRYTDWQNELIGGTANQTNAQISVSGGTANTQFLIGGGVFHQTTVFPGNTAFVRRSGRASVNHTSENLKFRATLSASYVSGANNLNADYTYAAISLPPNAPRLYNEEGNLNWENNTWTNPLASLQKKYEQHSDNLITDASLSYEVLPDIRLKTSLGYTTMNIDETSTLPISSYDPAYASYYKGSSVFASGNMKTWIAEPQLDYSKDFRDASLTILFGTTFQESVQQGQTIEATGYTSDALLENILAAGNVRILSSAFSQYRYSAFFGRINYKLKDKYILNLTGRRDGSSRFGPGNRFGNFGAIGAAWIFSNEKFIGSVFPFLAFGKLRASYGVTGNDAVGNYQYFNTYSSVGYPYNNDPGLMVTRLSNTDYSWETNKKFEMAMDLGVFDNRIIFSICRYYHRSSNQLIGLPLPVMTGQNTIQFNFPAKVENRGWELQLQTENIKLADFEWTTAINLTVPHNELIEFPNIESFPSYKNSYQVGKSVFTRRTLTYAGVDPGSGVYTFKDVNADGNISLSGDGSFLTEVGQQYFGGFNNSFRFKGFQLDIFFQFVKQTGPGYVSGFSWPGTSSNQPVQVLERWQNPGDNTNVQRYSALFSPAAIASFYYNASDVAIVDASFLRLKNIFLSWQLPSNWVKDLKIQESRIFIQGQNLFTATPYVGLDPENQNTQVLPPLRVITFGAQLTF